MCRDLLTHTLANRDLAFDGTVTAVDGDHVILTVNERCWGSGGDEVTLTASGMTGTVEDLREWAEPDRWRALPRRVTAPSPRTAASPNPTTRPSRGGPTPHADRGRPYTANTEDQIGGGDSAHPTVWIPPIPAGSRLRRHYVPAVHCLAAGPYCGTAYRMLVGSSHVSQPGADSTP